MNKYKLLLIIPLLLSCDDDDDAFVTIKTKFVADFKFENSSCKLYELRKRISKRFEIYEVVNRFFVCNPPIPGMIKGSNLLKENPEP